MSKLSEEQIERARDAMEEGAVAVARFAAEEVERERAKLREMVDGVSIDKPPSYRPDGLTLDYAAFVRLAALVAELRNDAHVLTVEPE